MTRSKFEDFGPVVPNKSPCRKCRRWVEGLYGPTLYCEECADPSIVRAAKGRVK